MNKLKKLAMSLIVLFGFSCTLISLAADFNGDGTDDITVYRPSSSGWFVRGLTRIYFGTSSDQLAEGDYNGDGTDEVAIYRKDSGLWAVLGITRVYFGEKSDKPCPGDYNGDGTSDLVIFRPSTGLWALRGLTRAYYGGFSDIPVPGSRCRLTVTGRTYSEQTGDDGYYQMGVSFNFQTRVISGDLVTLDYNTGLMWAADGDEQGCNFSNQTTWSSAVKYYNNLTFAGYTDWRLPNIRELLSIYDYRASPFNGYFPNMVANHYWSSSWRMTTPSSADVAWSVNFENGEVDLWDNMLPFARCYIRGVRGGE